MKTKQQKPGTGGPRKRFRIERLEERIAPKKSNTNGAKCVGGSVNTSDTGGGSLY